MAPPRSNVKKSATDSLAVTNRIIIGLPLLLSFIFALSLMAWQQVTIKQGLSAQRPAGHANTDPSSILPTIAQPKLPNLDVSPTGLDNPLAPSAESNDRPVGPSSTDAGASLQSTAQDHQPNGNASLQATRKALKLDDLHL